MQRFGFHHNPFTPTVVIALVNLVLSDHQIHLNQHLKTTVYTMFTLFSIHATLYIKVVSCFFYHFLGENIKQVCQLQSGIFVLNNRVWQS